MRIFKHLFTLVIFVSLIACSSDDNTPAYALNNTNLSAGSYDVTYLTTAATETINVNGLDIITETTSEGETFQLTVAFAENNTYVVDGQYVLNTLVTVAGEFVSQSTIIVDVDNETGQMTPKTLKDCIKHNKLKKQRVETGTPTRTTQETYVQIKKI